MSTMATSRVGQYGVPLWMHALRKLHGANTGVFDSLKRGVAVLKSEAQLQQYLFSYGLAHGWKLKLALSSLMGFDGFMQEKSIRVIDYGCGQGIATLGLLSELRESQLNAPTINQVVLIEPSTAAIQKAESWVSNSCDNVLALNAGIDQFAGQCFDWQHEAHVHLLSNILDMADVAYAMKNLERLVFGALKGTHYFVCVSPHNWDGRLDSFCDIAKKHGRIVEEVNFYQRHTERDWHAQGRVFKLVVK